MKINCICIILFMSTFLSVAQQLEYKSKGKVLDSYGIKLSPFEVKKLLVDQPELLTKYTDARSQKIAGNVLLYAGIAGILGDLVKGTQYDVVYPTGLTYAGLGTILLSFILKSGYTKDIKNVVTEYNSNLKNNKIGIKIEKIDFITNSNGAGLKIVFN